MTHLDHIAKAYQANKLLVLWGAVPFPLAARRPNAPVLLLNQSSAKASSLALPSITLTDLPPLPILSVDPSNQIEAQFQQAAVPLHSIQGRQQVIKAGQHSLLKLGGDLQTRQGVVLSREELDSLTATPDKGYLLQAVQPYLKDGVLLLLGADPANADFVAWWSGLAKRLGPSASYAVGDSAVAWPDGIIGLDVDFGLVCEGLAQRTLAQAGPADMTDFATLTPANIARFKAIQQQFTSEALSVLLYDTPQLQPAYRTLPAGATNPQTIQHLIAFAEKNDLFDFLHTLAPPQKPTAD